MPPLFSSYHTYHLAIKGFIMYSTIEIERKMDKFLSRHFCSDINKQHEFCNTVLYHERITFDFKKELLTGILKSDLYKHFLIANSEFLNALDKIPLHRNRFAHLEDVKSEELKSILKDKTTVQNGMNLENHLDSVDVDTIIYKRYKNGKLTYIGYNKNEVYRLEHQVHSVMDLFDELNSEQGHVNDALTN